LKHGFLILAALAAMPSYAADSFTITTATTGTWDCAASRTPDGGGASTVPGPGDIIKLDGGTRANLRIEGCVGADGNEIQIINDPADSARVTFRNFGTTSAFDIRESRHVIIDGTGGWIGDDDDAVCGAPAGEDASIDGCGFLIDPDSNDSPVAYFRFFGAVTRDIEVRGVGVTAAESYDDPAPGAGARYGFYLHDVSTTQAAAGSGVFREDFLIEENYVTGTRGTAYYVGPNWTESTGCTDTCLRLRDIEIRYNAAIDVGGNGIIFKSAVEGTNSVHHNYIRTTATRLDDTAADCIRTADGYADMHGNDVAECGGKGIAWAVGSDVDVAGPFSADIYNNVIRDTGTEFPEDGYGIRTSSPGDIDITPEIWHNTVVDAGDDGINAISGNGNVSHVIKNNIVADAVGTAIVSTGGTTGGNVTGTEASFNFKSATNFRLTGASLTAIGQGVAGFPTTDIRGFTRPAAGGNAADAGAYEIGVWNIWANETNCTASGGTACPGGAAETQYPDFGAWDCNATAHNVTPGDAIYLRARLSGAATFTERTNRIWFRDCVGTRDDPIVIQNHASDLGPTIFRPAANLGLPSIRIIRSDWVTLDGTTHWTSTAPPNGHVVSTDDYCGYPAGRMCGIRIESVTGQRTTDPVMFIQASYDFVDNSDRPETYDGSRGIVIQGVEIDGTNSWPVNGAGAGNTAPWPGSESGRVGIYMHHAASPADGLAPGGLTEHPGAWREDFKVGTGPGKGNWIHRVFGEFIYFGNNTTAVECNEEYCVPMRGMEIAYNLLEESGRDGVNPKMWMEGTEDQPTNEIHHNYIADCAQRLESWEQPCIAVNTNSVDIYSNIIVRPWGEGINYGTRADQDTNTANWQCPGNANQFGCFQDPQGKIYNNVIYQAGFSDIFYGSDGGSPQEIDPSCVNVNNPDQSTTDSCFDPDPDDEAAINVFFNADHVGTVLIYNNTLVGSDGYAINWTSNNSVEMAMNNIIAQDANTNYVCVTPVATNCPTADTGFIKSNYKSTIAGAGFVNAGALNFALASTITGGAVNPNIDSATSTSQGTIGDYTGVIPVPSFDLEDVARPLNGLYDKGAYEFAPGEAPVIDPIRIVKGIQQ
jgi:hypothetical protein